MPRSPAFEALFWFWLIFLFVLAARSPALEAHDACVEGLQ